MTCCYLRNAHDIGPEGKTAFEKRFGEAFSGPIIPFGASIQYKASRPKEIDEVKWGKTKPGLFAGNVLNAGGGWTGDVDVLDAVELTNALLHSEVHCRRVSSNEIQIDNDSNGDFKFPARTDEWQQPVDSKNFTKVIRKKVFETDRGDNTPLDIVQEDGTGTLRNQRRKERKLSEKDKREYCDFNDLMPEEEPGPEDTTGASEEGKSFLTNGS